MEKTNLRSDVTTSDHKHKYQTNSTTYIGVSIIKIVDLALFNSLLIGTPIPHESLA